MEYEGMFAVRNKTQLRKYKYKVEETMMSICLQTTMTKAFNANRYFQYKTSLDKG